MYKENRNSLNWFVGCEHGCIYCKPSFQRQMKRQGKRCQKCYRYEPHAHLERLLKRPPKTVGDEFIFFPSSGDPAFASLFELDTALQYARRYAKTKFLVQSKNPGCFIEIDFPDNVILATTIETNRTNFNTPSIYKKYSQISQAPSPYARYLAMLEVQHKHKMLTIEPILQFDHGILLSWILKIKPEIVYIGYDNHKCRLPEPIPEETKLLIERMKLFTEVRVKTLRKAWYEK